MRRLLILSLACGLGLTTIVRAETPMQAKEAMSLSPAKVQELFFGAALQAEWICCKA